MGPVCAPGVLHDEIFLSLVVMGDADNGHGVAFTLPADPMMPAHRTFGLCQQRIHGDVIEAVVHPVVRQVDLHLLVVRCFVVTCQGDILVRGTDAAGKLLWGVSGAEHEHPAWGGRLHLPHRIIAHDTVFLDEVDKRLAHPPFAFWCLRLLLHLLFDIIR